MELYHRPIKCEVVSALALRMFKMSCGGVPDQIKSIFTCVDSRNLKGCGQVSPKRLEEIRRILLNHDLSEFIQEEYVLVRILEGKMIGASAYIKLSALSEPKTNDTRTVL